MSSIYREMDTSSGKSVAIDAKQRVILVKKEQVQLSPATLGQPAQFVTRIVACAEPSPDALSVFGASFSGELKDKEAIGKVAAALAETGATIGLRTQTIQLLRDSMFRLCEAYMSGAISGGEFARSQRMAQHYMVGLLAIEQLTRITTAPPVILRATSSTGSTGDGDNGRPTAIASSTSEPTETQRNAENSAIAEPLSKTVETIVQTMITGEQVGLLEERCLDKLMGATSADKDNPGIDFCKNYLMNLTPAIVQNGMTLNAPSQIK